MPISVRHAGSAIWSSGLRATPSITGVASIANYCDLPLWDILFGSFRNPGARETPVAAGFYRGASARLAAMLAFGQP